VTIARKQLGARGELAARRYLESRGLSFVAANVTTRYGELDLVMRDGATLVAVEVKTRGSLRHGLPQDAVDWRKLGHITRTMQTYLQYSGHTGPWRVDVVALHGQDTTHLRDVTSQV